MELRGAETRYGHDLVLAFAVNENMNQIVLEHIDPAAWNAKSPGSRTRAIASIFAHVHNIRRKWIRLSAPHLKLPSMLDRACTQQQARRAFAEAGECCTNLIEEALFSTSALMPQFLRDGWARPWPAGPMMVAYMITHEAHHRGQVCLLAHQIGYPLSASATSEMWNWEKIQKRCKIVTEPQSRKARQKASS